MAKMNLAAYFLLFGSAVASDVLSDLSALSADIHELERDEAQLDAEDQLDSRVEKITVGGKEIHIVRKYGAHNYGWWNAEPTKYCKAEPNVDGQVACADADGMVQDDDFCWSADRKDENGNRPDIVFAEDMLSWEIMKAETDGGCPNLKAMAQKYANALPCTASAGGTVQEPYMNQIEKDKHTKENGWQDPPLICEAAWQPPREATKEEKKAGIFNSPYPPATIAALQGHLSAIIEKATTPEGCTALFKAFSLPLDPQDLKTMTDGCEPKTFFPGLYQLGDSVTCHEAAAVKTGCKDQEDWYLGLKGTAGFRDAKSGFADEAGGPQNPWEYGTFKDAKTQQAMTPVASKAKSKGRVGESHKMSTWKDNVKNHCTSTAGLLSEYHHCSTTLWTAVGYEDPIKFWPNGYLAGMQKENRGYTRSPTLFRNCGVPFACGVSGTIAAHLVKMAGQDLKFSGQMMLVLIAILQLGRHHSFLEITVAAQNWVQKFCVDSPNDKICGADLKETMDTITSPFDVSLEPQNEAVCSLTKEDEGLYRKSTIGSIFSAIKKAFPDRDKYVFNWESEETGILPTLKNNGCLKTIKGTIVNPTSPPSPTP